MPFFWFAIMGTGFNNLISVGGASYIEFLLPGIIGMTLLFSSMFSGISVLVDKQFGFMKEILVAPISRLSIMLGKTLGGATTALINGIIILLLAILLGIGIDGLSGIAIAILFMLLISSSFVSLGVAIASKMTDTSGFQMIMNFLIMPMFLLSGAMFPLDATPIWMQSIAFLNPMFYGVDGLRGALIGVSILPVFLDLFVLLGFCTVTVLAGTYLFRKTEA